MKRKIRNNSISRSRQTGMARTDKSPIRIDSTGRYHRRTGQYGTNYERDAFLDGAQLGFVHGEQHGAKRMLDRIMSALPRVLTHLISGSSSSPGQTIKIQGKQRRVVVDEVNK